MIKIRTIQENDYSKLVEWNMGKDEDYLFQWSGLKTYVYPITVEQIEVQVQKSNIYMIENEDMTIGSIELSNIDSKTKCAHICRFILQEEMRNKGYGEWAIKELCRMAFEELSLDTLNLRVYCFNIGAIKCYQKVGFIIKEQHQQIESRWNYYTMELVRGMNVRYKTT